MLDSTSEFTFIFKVWNSLCLVLVGLQYISSTDIND